MDDKGRSHNEEGEIVEKLWTCGRFSGVVFDDIDEGDRLGFFSASCCVRRPAEQRSAGQPEAAVPIFQGSCRRKSENHDSQKH